ncbi:MAG TPA: cellulose binding domain-containing protein [Candidatus Limnocylindrales bacterium]|nr:cellulose binding domain-containing protein [Candidatus Limnocylindrales bacterium]
MYRKSLFMLITSLIATLLATTAAVAPAQAALPSPFTCRYVLWPWQGGFSADLFITNNGPAIDGWIVHWTFEEPTQLLGVWSAEMKMPTPHDAVATPMPWNKVLNTGSMVVFGWTAFAPKTEVPDDITVNGIPC